MHGYNREKSFCVGTVQLDKLEPSKQNVMNQLEVHSFRGCKDKVSVTISIPYCSVSSKYEPKPCSSREDDHKLLYSEKEEMKEEGLRYITRA